MVSRWLAWLGDLAPQMELSLCMLAWWDWRVLLMFLVWVWATLYTYRWHRQELSRTNTWREDVVGNR